MRTRVKPAGTEKPLLQRLFKTYPRQFWIVLSHNLQWKLLALFLAVCLWVGLILQDPSLTRERVFTDVPLTITGAETLRRNGFIVVHGAGGRQRHREAQGRRAPA